jgi:hypothetical protein
MMMMKYKNYVTNQITLIENNDDDVESIRKKVFFALFCAFAIECDETDSRNVFKMKVDNKNFNAFLTDLSA